MSLNEAWENLAQIKIKQKMENEGKKNKIAIKEIYSKWMPTLKFLLL